MGGLFDWFWEFLYGISKCLFRMIDGLMSCANMLCGIDPITVDDEEVDFLNYLITHDKVMFAFETACIIGIVLVGLFAIFSIIRAMTTEKGMTPWQVFTKSFKTLFTFLFVPVCMITFVYFSTMIMETLYKSILGDTNGGIGKFLVGAFSQDGVRGDADFYLREGFDYMNTDRMWQLVDLSDFDYIFSWIAGLCILITLGQSLLMFVDRAISLVLLFIVSPISISTAVMDDGAHFKLWRDQVLVKFITGFGCIIGLNVYILIITLITDSMVVFFTSSFLNNLMKIAFIVGGAVSMQRIMALVGNLVSAGAGSNELRDNAIANSGFKSAVGSMGKALTAPFRATKSAANFVNDAKQYGLGSTVGSALGFKTSKDYGGQSEIQKQIQSDRMKRKEESRMRQNTDFANKIGLSVANAISGNRNNGGGGSGQNQNPMQGKNDKPVNGLIMASISGGNNNKKDEKK